MERIDIAINPGETISIQYPSCERSIDSLVVKAKKRMLQMGTDFTLTPFFSITGDNSDIIILQIPDTSFMGDWNQWGYDIKAVDTDGLIFYPYYGLIYNRNTPVSKL